MIQSIFKNHNTNKLSGHLIVEELIPFVGAPAIAESYIMEMIKAGTLIQDGKNLVLNIETPITTQTQPVQETEPSIQEIKEAWFKLRQLEKTNILPSNFKKKADNFCEKYGWNYYIFNTKLRNECKELGYHSEPSERQLFQKEVLQK